MFNKNVVVYTNNIKTEVSPINFEKWKEFPKVFLRFSRNQRLYGNYLFLKLSPAFWSVYSSVPLCQDSRSLEMDQSIVFKNSKTGKMEQISSSNIELVKNLLVHGTCVCFSEVVLFTDMVDSTIQ